jgi:predicted Zn finger-like uncharacterized protein
MNIICPKCSTVYKLDYKKLLPNGKTVKCIKCHNVWFEKHTKSTAKEEIYRYPLPMIIKHDTKKSFSKKLLIISTMTCALLFSFVFFQDFFFDRIPAASRVYDKIGLPVTANIILDEFEINRKEQNIIDINGFIINKSEQTRRVPALKITLVDKSGQIIKKIITKTPSLYFESNQKQHFFYEITNAPENTHIVSIKIADKLDVMGIST